ncbi:hypothetical protein V8C42DRAFT_338929, partial [Trichoderma barbatum]
LTHMWTVTTVLTLKQTASLSMMIITKAPLSTNPQRNFLILPTKLSRSTKSNVLEIGVLSTRNSKTRSNTPLTESSAKTRSVTRMSVTMDTVADAWTVLGTTAVFSSVKETNVTRKLCVSTAHANLRSVATTAVRNLFARMTNANPLHPPPADTPTLEPHPDDQHLQPPQPVCKGEECKSGNLPITVVSGSVNIHPFLVMVIAGVIASLARVH